MQILGTGCFRRSLGRFLVQLVGQSARYSSMLEQKLKDPQVVLDEHPIRGSGDAYCIQKSEAQITIQLAYAVRILCSNTSSIKILQVYIRSVEIEQAAAKIERHHEYFPTHAKITLTPSDPQTLIGSEEIDVPAVLSFDKSHTSKTVIAPIPKKILRYTVL